MGVSGDMIARVPNKRERTTYALQNSFIAVRTVGRYEKLFDSVLEVAIGRESPFYPPRPGTLMVATVASGCQPPLQ